MPATTKQQQKEERMARDAERAELGEAVTSDVQSDLSSSESESEAEEELSAAAGSKKRGGHRGAKIAGIVIGAIVVYAGADRCLGGPIFGKKSVAKSADPADIKTGAGTKDVTPKGGNGGTADNKGPAKGDNEETDEEGKKKPDETGSGKTDKDDDEKTGPKPKPGMSETTRLEGVRTLTKYARSQAQNRRHVHKHAEKIRGADGVEGPYNAKARVSLQTKWHADKRAKFAEWVAESQNEKAVEDQRLQQLLEEIEQIRTNSAAGTGDVDAPADGDSAHGKQPEKSTPAGHWERLKAWVWGTSEPQQPADDAAAGGEVVETKTEGDGPTEEQKQLLEAKQKDAQWIEEDIKRLTDAAERHESNRQAATEAIKLLNDMEEADKLIRSEQIKQEAEKRQLAGDSGDVGQRSANGEGATSEGTSAETDDGDDASDKQQANDQKQDGEQKNLEQQASADQQVDDAPAQDNKGGAAA